MRAEHPHREAKRGQDQEKDWTRKEENRKQKAESSDGEKKKKKRREAGETRWTAVGQAAKESGLDRRPSIDCAAILIF
jgi:hypothetical protein